MNDSKEKKVYASVKNLGVKRKGVVWGLIPQKILSKPRLLCWLRMHLPNIKLGIGDKEFESSFCLQIGMPLAI